MICRFIQLQTSRRTAAIGRAMLAILISLTFLSATQDATAQSLSDRIQQVKKERARRDAAKSIRSKVHLLQALFYKDIDVSYDHTPIRTVLEHLASQLDIPIVGRYLDQKNVDGIDPAEPITLDLEKVPAITVLDLILEQCGDDDACTWQLGHGFVEVGTKDRLAKRSSQVLRVYPIGDLVYEPPNFADAPELGIIMPEQGQYGGYGGAGLGGSIHVSSTGAGHASDRSDPSLQLLELILETIEPEGWTQNGGNWGTIRLSQGSLIVKAPDFVQRQIGGYPPVPPPSRARSEGKAASRPAKRPAAARK